MRKKLIVFFVLMILGIFLVKQVEPVQGQTSVCDGLVSYWKLDETININPVIDSVGGNTGTATGTNIVTPGKVGAAYRTFSSSYISCTDANCGGTNKLDMGTSDWTVSAWVKTSASAGIIASKTDYTGGGNPDGWYMGVKWPSGRLDAYIRKNGSGEVFSTDDGLAINDGISWHHVAVVFDRDLNMTRYVDGSPTGIANNISALNTKSIDNAKAFVIGARDIVGDYQFFNGSIDEVGVWNRVLSQSEIQELAAGDTCPYLPGYPGIGSTGNSFTPSSIKSKISVSPYNWQVENSSEVITGFGVNQTKYGYQHFYNKLGIVPGTTPVFTGSEPGTNGVYYSDIGSAINTAWNVNGSGKSYIIVINGNLTISKQITVNEGNFVAFIVKNDIIFDKYLGLNPQANWHSYKLIDGVYIADGTISTGNTLGETQPNKKQFIAKGMFVAYGGFSLGRDLGTSNPTMPGEGFLYRPDFLVNFPREMATRRITWREVAP